MIKVTVVGECKDTDIQSIESVEKLVGELFNGLEEIRLSLTKLAVKAVKELGKPGSIAKSKLDSIKPSLERIKQFLNEDTG